eukprot:3935999-Rhodomonas_salina.1
MQQPSLPAIPCYTHQGSRRKDVFQAPSIQAEAMSKKANLRNAYFRHRAQPSSRSNRMSTATCLQIPRAEKRKSENARSKNSPKRSACPFPSSSMLSTSSRRNGMFTGFACNNSRRKRQQPVKGKTEGGALCRFLRARRHAWEAGRGGLGAAAAAPHRGLENKWMLAAAYPNLNSSTCASVRAGAINVAQAFVLHLLFIGARSTV